MLSHLELVVSGTVSGGILPTVTLSLKGTGNWNVHLPQPTSSEGTSETPPTSSQSATGSLEASQSGIESRQQTSGSGQEMTSSTLESSSYTTLKAATVGGQPPSAVQTLRTGTTGSRYSSSITTEVKSETEGPGSGRTPQLVPASNQRGFLLSHTGPTDSTKVPFSNNKLPSNPLKPSALNSQPARSFNGTPGGQLTTDNSFVGSTVPTDQASSVLHSLQTTSSPQKGPITPALSSVPATQKADSQEELTDESTKATDVDDDSLYSSRAKLFYKKGEEFVELGVGTLKVEAFPGKVARVLLRSDNSLKTVILNISVTSQIPLTLTKNNLLVLCPEPNPPLGIEVRPVGYLIRVKMPSDAQRLLDVINAHTGHS